MSKIKSKKKINKDEKSVIASRGECSDRKFKLHYARSKKKSIM